VVRAAPGEGQICRAQSRHNPTHRVRSPPHGRRCPRRAAVSAAQRCATASAPIRAVLSPCHRPAWRVPYSGSAMQTPRGGNPASARTRERRKRIFVAEIYFSRRDARSTHRARKPTGAARALRGARILCADIRGGAMPIPRDMRYGCAVTREQQMRAQRARNSGATPIRLLSFRYVVRVDVFIPPNTVSSPHHLTHAAYSQMPLMITPAQTIADTTPSAPPRRFC